MLVVALKNLVTPYFDDEFERGMATAATKGQGIPQTAIDTSRRFAGYLALAGPLLAPWFVGIFGGIFTTIGSRVVGAKLTFGQAATITSWSYFPAVIGYIAIALQGPSLTRRPFVV